jgi:hypothetical protein
MCVIADLRSVWTEFFRLLGYYAAWGGYKPTFRDSYSVLLSSTLILAPPPPFPFSLFPYSHLMGFLSVFSLLFLFSSLPVPPAVWWSHLPGPFCLRATRSHRTTCLPHSKCATPSLSAHVFSCIKPRFVSPNVFSDTWFSKMEPICSPETSVSNHVKTRNNPDDGGIYLFVMYQLRGRCP